MNKRVLKNLIIIFMLLTLCCCNNVSVKNNNSNRVPDNPIEGLVVGTDVPIEEQLEKAKSLKQYIYEYESGGSQGNYDPKWMDTVFFGYYPQSAKEQDTDDMIEWIVLDKDECKREAFLLSKNILDYIPYNYGSELMTWEKSSIRTWLNHNFYYFSFGRKERKKIVLKYLDNDIPDNPIALNSNDSTQNVIEANGGNITKDKVFLLSIDEANEYLKYCGLVGEGTKYIDTPGIALDYWLRTTGFKQNFAAYVYRNAVISNVGFYVNFSKGIRPAITVKY